MKQEETNGAILITSRSVGAGLPFLVFLLGRVGKWIGTYNHTETSFYAGEVTYVSFSGTNQSSWGRFLFGLCFISFSGCIATQSTGERQNHMID